MKRTLILLLTAALLMTGCDQPYHPAEGNSHRLSVESGKAYTLYPPKGHRLMVKVDILLPMTPVRNQQGNSLCWLYAMLDAIESDRMGVGDSVSLSTDYLARHHLAWQARRCFLSQGSTSVTQRGMLPMALRLMDAYGVVPHSAFHARGPVNYRVLCRKLERMATAVPSLSRLDTAVNMLMDDSVEYLPQHVYMYGAQYTPIEFAHSVYLPGTYVALTSFTHHPFGEPFVLEVPDNRMADRFLNVPLDRLMALIEQSLQEGHAVAWEGDVTEKGFSYASGCALVRRGTPVTARERQRQFEMRKTTDDHCMALVGLAHDRQGRRYFIAKGTWGTQGDTGGLMFLSEDYVRLKTIAVMVRSSVVRS